ncbi:AraC-like DNA-binding protein [Variovorax boronicumulans]|uniref:AraC family transcriptional regulator n=1 Tax=Variovorax boronicumulans TaxID=436515 RepID=UPI00278B32E5|nr:helix-turn-helix transcriptional regulator [Variovorax boronicumulans]MDP9920712.1 AraC-like DNA-binding protein [Variovorax boronicumulans]
MRGATDEFSDEARIRMPAGRLNMRKSGQDERRGTHGQGPWTFEFDKMQVRVAAVRIRTNALAEELPTHQHSQGQLAMVVRGTVTCEVPGALWMAPLHGGFWIPGGVPHSLRVSADGNVCFLFMEDAAAAMPQTCCSLSISPLLRELILHLAALPEGAQCDPQAQRLHAVLLDQLVRMPTEALHLPVSEEPRLRRLIDALTRDPADRTTAAQWASRLAMSERTLTRLVQLETGMSFGRWSQRLRLIVALQWLTSGLSVQQVAHDLGYDSVSAFIAMFRKAMGQPPARYLAQRR